MDKRIEYLREHFKINPTATISIEILNHDLKQFNVFNVMTGSVDDVVLTEFFDADAQAYFYAGYHAGNGKIYIRDVEHKQS